MSARVPGIVAIVLIATACEAPISLDHKQDPTGGGTQSTETSVAVSPARPAPGVMVTFDSGILGDGNRSWTFGDGGDATGVVVGHTFDAEGVYQITVVRDDGIGTYEHSFTLVVDDPAREPSVSTAQLRPDR